MALAEINISLEQLIRPKTHPVDPLVERPCDSSEVITKKEEVAEPIYTDLSSDAPSEAMKELVSRQG